MNKPLPFCGNGLAKSEGRTAQVAEGAPAVGRSGGWAMGMESLGTFAVS